MNIIEVLKEKNLSISTAESLTGGLIASKICNISGASSYFKGSIVAYTKEIKCNLLHLEMERIEKYGVYSNETVITMAENIQNLTSSDISISTSGVAGPGSDENTPAGTVYFCIRIKNKNNTYCEHFNGDRNQVREQSSEYIINKCIELIKDSI